VKKGEKCKDSVQKDAVRLIRQKERPIVEGGRNVIAKGGRRLEIYWKERIRGTEPTIEGIDSKKKGGDTKGGVQKEKTCCSFSQCIEISGKFTQSNSAKI